MDGRKEGCQSIICHDQHISTERGLGTRKEALPISLSAPIERLISEKSNEEVD